MAPRFYILLLCPLVAAAQTIAIVSGNGQVICPLCAGAGALTFDPLVVAVTNNGAPVANATVNWTLTSGNGTLAGARTVTDANGLARNTFSQDVPQASDTALSFVQDTISANVSGASVQFTETLALAGPKGVRGVFVDLLSPQLSDVVVGPAGQSGAAFRVMVTANQGSGVVGVPGVEVKVTSDPSLPSTVTCAAARGLPAGTVVTDSNGLASCTPIFGGKPGTAQFTIRVGGSYSVYGPGVFQVTLGAPGFLRVIDGNNQSANPGTPLPRSLVARVDDLAGNWLSGVAVAWEVIQGTATLSDKGSVSDRNGQVTTSVLLGSSAGPIKVRARVAADSSIAVVFDETANAVISQLQKAAGDGQDALVNTAFAQPLAVQVSNGGQPVSGAVVQFTVTAGSATVASPSVVTDAQGRASTNVTAGAATGPVAITAAAGSFSVTFTLNVRSAGPTNLSFFNAASFQQDFVSPCGLTWISGAGLAPGIQGSVAPPLFGPLPYQMAGVSVQFDGNPAPIYSVANVGGQESVVVQVPCELAPATVSVTVRVGDGATTVNLQVRAASPGIFEYAMTDNRKRAIVLRPDGSIVSLENPARRGEILRVYSTGLGVLSPGIGTNQRDKPGVDETVVGSVSVMLNNAAVRVVAAKYSEDLVGVYVVDFELPADASTGNDIPLVIGVDQASSAASALPVN